MRDLRDLWSLVGRIEHGNEVWRARRAASSAETDRVIAEADAALARIGPLMERVATAAYDDALRFWVERADRFEEALPPEKAYMKARGVLSESYLFGRAAATPDPGSASAAADEPGETK